MSKRALIVGINEYDDQGIRNLRGCVADAQSMHDVLGRHDDRRVNYHNKILLSPGAEAVSRANLRLSLVNLFAFDGDVLFYFSGHGSLEESGGFIATQDAVRGDPGIYMNELLALANKSHARSILMILDCCFSGALGNDAADVNMYPQASIREGITILAASRPDEPAHEKNGQGVFTELVVGALKGGAANVRGQVSAASVYGYVEAALGPWDQRPLYKSHANKLEPIRECDPLISDGLIRELVAHFPKPDFEYQLDPTYEETNVNCAVPAHVETFKKFKQYQIAGLLKNRSGRDLYWTAEQSGKVLLTSLGQFYWRLARGGRI